MFVRFVPNPGHTPADGTHATDAHAQFARRRPQRRPRGGEGPSVEMLSSQDDFDDDLELQESTESKHSSKSNTGTSNSGSTTSNEDYGVPPEVL